MVFDFVIVAFAVFLFINALSRLNKKKDEAPVVETPKPTKEELLLTEIRDLLKENKAKE